MPSIYKIICKTNNKIYVGSTSNKLKRRWNNHKSMLMTNTHHCRRLQNAWNEYGEAEFSCELIEKTDIQRCREREQYWIDFYDLILFNSEKEVLPGTKSYSYLTEDDVKDIIKKCENGAIRAKLAKQYGVTSQTISDIAMGRSWSYLPRNKIRWNPCHVIPDEEIDKIKDYAKSGLTHKNIALIYGVNQSTISRIISRSRRKEIRYAL